VLTFGFPAGFWLGLLVPAIIALHFFRRRQQVFPVSGLFLWREEGLENPPGSRLEPIRATLSLLLQLLAAVILTLLVAQPGWTHSGLAAHFVAVIDNGAAMSAAAPGEESTKSRVEALLKKRWAELPDYSRITLILTGEHPSFLGTPAQSISEALAALDQWHPTGSFTPPLPALEKAFRQAEGTVTFYTCRLKDLPHLSRLAVVALGKPLSNHSLLQPGRTREQDDTERIFVRVRNNDATPATVRLIVSAEEKILLSKELELPARGEVPFVANLSRTELPIRLRLEPEDTLELDSNVTLPPPRSDLLRVHLLLPDLSVARPVKKVLAALPRLRLVDEKEAADWAIGTATMQNPAKVFETRLVGLPKEAPGENCFLGPYAIERRQNVTRGLSLSGVVWSGAGPVLDCLLPMVACGDTPLLYEYRRPQGRWVALNLHPGRSNLPETPDWPILWSNLADEARAELPGPAKTCYRFGETIRFLLEKPETDLRLDGPIQRTLPDGECVVLSDLDQGGLYRVTRDGKTLASFSLAFADEREGDLSSLETGTITPDNDPGIFVQETEHQDHHLRLIGWLLLLGLLLLEWALKAGAVTAETPKGRALRAL